MKLLKHLYYYLTSPLYRFYTSMWENQRFIDEHRNLLEDNLRLQSKMIFTVDGDKIPLDLTQLNN